MTWPIRLATCHPTHEIVGNVKEVAIWSPETWKQAVPSYSKLKICEWNKLNSYKHSYIRYLLMSKTVWRRKGSTERLSLDPQYRWRKMVWQTRHWCPMLRFVLSKNCYDKAQIVAWLIKLFVCYLSAKTSSETNTPRKWNRYTRFWGYGKSFHYHFGDKAITRLFRKELLDSDMLCRK